MPMLPFYVKHVWENFLELTRRRKGNGFSPDPLQYNDIDAWARLTKRTLDQWELQTILDIDDEYLLHVANSKPKK